MVGLPVLIVPLWQVAQLPVVTTTEECSIVPTKLMVDLWQVLQPGHEVVGTWLLDLPNAVVPLWQFSQPEIIPVWLTFAPAQVVLFL